MTENNLTRAAASAGELMESFFGAASPSTVFSEPHLVGDELVFTAGAWERAGGFGFGGGDDERDNGGGGAGGGGVSGARPVAVIRVTPEGTEVTPVADVTKIVVTVILSALGVWRALKA